MNEIWKDVVDYEGIYMVSNLGRVKSLKFNREKILKSNINSSGYYTILLYNKNRINRTVHQLVAQSFLEHIPCGFKLVVDHINDIKTDNKVENLQIVTTRFNCKKKQGNYSSQYKGVYICKRKHKDKVYIYYKAQIQINKNSKLLGYYKNEYDAHLAYQNALNNLSL